MTAPLALCGTTGGARRHRAAGEYCATCWQAERDYARDRRRPRTPQPDLPRWEQAACAGMDTDLFFPDSDNQVGVKAAARVCAGCPIRTPCAAWALEHEGHGVWGGMSAAARKRLKAGAPT